ncbi:flagellar FliJ protein [Desulfitispora alkaliphila]|uniref:flagellar export protein FliJ n=1 Tax=Desulfitispora alkaliphila TaxID=622674 RepID=UPI003D2630C6
MKFKFSLQRVLDLKEQEEQQVKLRLQIEQKKLLEKQEQVEHLKDKIYKCLEQKKEKRITTGFDLIQYHQYTGYLEQQMKNAQREVFEQERVIGRVQQELLKITREKQTFQKLKERQFAVFKQEQDKLEQQQIDELTIVKHCYKKRN